ncbi:hypothetical protein HDU82_003288 [Entophlyctis luteolus]|nr:hypothetical protein HDU82_003288 [Entophlyctis luteolus]KAJ3380627.1 hypothetical protein HDU84_005676 [Entophlyctis sp. JEL0112]
MPKLPFADERTADAATLARLRARRPRGELLYLDRMLLHSPALARAWGSMFGTVRADPSSASTPADAALRVTPRLRELAICVVGTVAGAAYEFGQHAPDFLANGGSREQLRVVATKDGVELVARHGMPHLFDALEQAVIRLALEMTLDGEGSSDALQAVRQPALVAVGVACPDGQDSELLDAVVVELVGAIAGYNMVARFLRTVGITELEDIAVSKEAKL